MMEFTASSPSKSKFKTHQVLDPDMVHAWSDDDDDDVSKCISDSFLNKSMLILQRPDQLGKGVFKIVITF